MSFDKVLITVSELASTPGWPVVLDCRFDLSDTDAGRRAYDEGHIPGAHYVHLDRDLCAAVNGRNGRHPLPTPADFYQRLASWGMAKDTRVVAYDASGGMYAARLWWMMRWLGFDGARVLDGGWPAWRSAGQPISLSQAKDVSGRPSCEAASYGGGELPPLPNTKHAVLVDEVLSRVKSPGREGAAGAGVLLDARSPARFRGEGESLDPVAGHIPGALNRFYQDNLDDQGRFKASTLLRAEFAGVLGDVDPSAVIHYCGSGVTACHNALAMEVAGLAGSRLYAGSWSEWCSDPGRPVAS